MTLLKRALSLILPVIFVLFVNVSACPSVIVRSADKLTLPPRSSFTDNSEFIRPLKKKKITVAEYVTDPLILYSTLWLCFSAAWPLHEDDTMPKFIYGPDPGGMFLNRLKMEPFATGRTDYVMKPWLDAQNNVVRDLNGNPLNTFRKDVYAKNIIEPVFFVYMGLYLRSKNYHPAIMITELILLSLIYELTVRPFFMNSSFEQLFKNPAVGIVISILLDELSTFLLTTPYMGLHVLAYILNPFNAIPNSRVHPMLFFDTYTQTASLETIIKLN